MQRTAALISALRYDYGMSSMPLTRIAAETFACRENHSGHVCGISVRRVSSNGPRSRRADSRETVSHRYFSFCGVLSRCLETRSKGDLCVVAFRVCGFNGVLHLCIHRPSRTIRENEWMFQRPERLPRSVRRVNLFSVRGGSCRWGVFHVPVNRRNIGNRKTPYLYLFIFTPVHGRVIDSCPYPFYTVGYIMCGKTVVIRFIGKIYPRNTAVNARRTCTPNHFCFTFTRRF